MLPLHQPPPQLDSYLVLLRLLCLRLLHFAAEASHRQLTAAPLHALPLLLDVKSYAGVAKEDDATRWAGQLRAGLLRSSGVELLGQAIGNIVRAFRMLVAAKQAVTEFSSLFQSPLDKKHPSLPPLVATLAQLLKPPLASSAVVPSLLDSIFTLPLLPNRLPIPSLTLLSRSLPWPEILAADPTLRSKDRASTVNLISNLSAFGVSRVPGWKSAQRDQWAAILARILNSLDAPLQVSSAGPALTTTHSSQPESDSEDTPQLVASGPALSSKVVSHLNLLTSSAHLSGLLAAPSVSIYSFVLALIEAWPAKAQDVLDELGKRRGVLRELWRGFVRSGEVGRQVIESGGGKGILDAHAGEPYDNNCCSCFRSALTPLMLLLCRRTSACFVATVPAPDGSL